MSEQLENTFFKFMESNFNEIFIEKIKDKYSKKKNVQQIFFHLHIYFIANLSIKY